MFLAIAQFSFYMMLSASTSYGAMAVTGMGTYWNTWYREWKREGSAETPSDLSSHVTHNSGSLSHGQLTTIIVLAENVTS